MDVVETGSVVWSRVVSTAEYPLTSLPDGDFEDSFLFRTTFELFSEINIS